MFIVKLSVNVIFWKFFSFSIQRISIWMQFCFCTFH